MRKFLKFTLILISLSLILITVASAGAYVYLSGFADLEIDSSVILCEMQNEKSRLYAYNFENRKSREGSADSSPYAYLSDGRKYEYAKDALGVKICGFETMTFEETHLCPACLHKLLTWTKVIEED